MGRSIDCWTISTLVLLSLANSHQVSSITQNKSMIEKIIYCDTVNFLNGSSYISRCNNVSNNTNDIDYAVCMAISDVTFKICSYSSRSHIHKHKLILPNSIAEFDATVEKLDPRPAPYEQYINSFCKNISAIFDKLHDSEIKSDTDMIHYINVSENIFKHFECKNYCHEKDDNGVKLKPLCMALLWFDQVLSQMKSPEVIKNKDEDLLIKNEAPLVDNMPKKEQSTKDDKKDVHEVIHMKDHTKKKVVSELTVEQSVNNSSKASTHKTKASNIISVNEKTEAKKDSELPPPIEEEKDVGKIPPSTNINKADEILPKQLENIEKPNTSQRDDNPDIDLNLPEEHPNKKGNENEGDEINDPDNIDDSKGAINEIDGGEFAPGNLGEQHDLPQDKKFYLHSSIAKEKDESHFYTYFSIISLFCIGLYVGHHNKRKILGMLLEGRRGRRGRGSRRRPSTASYRKLDCNLEEAVTSQCNSNVTQVIY